MAASLTRKLFDHECSEGHGFYWPLSVDCVVFIHGKPCRGEVHVVGVDSRKANDLLTQMRKAREVPNE